MLMAFGSEVYGDVLVEVGVGHFCQLFLEFAQGLIEGDSFQFETLVFRLYLQFIEGLVEIEILDQVAVHVPQL